MLWSTMLLLKTMIYDRIVLFPYCRYDSKHVYLYFVESNQVEFLGTPAILLNRHCAHISPLHLCLTRLLRPLVPVPPPPPPPPPLQRHPRGVRPLPLPQPPQPRLQAGQHAVAEVQGQPVCGDGGRGGGGRGGFVVDVVIVLVIVVVVK